MKAITDPRYLALVAKLMATDAKTDLVAFEAIVDEMEALERTLAEKEQAEGS